MADTDSSTARIVPKQRKQFSWASGYQVTSPRGMAQIANRYGNGSGGDVRYAQPGEEEIAQTGRVVDETGDRTMEFANPNLSPPPAAANPALGGVLPAPGVAPTVPGGPVVNPNTGAPMAKNPQELQQDAQAEWLARGGSVASMHRAQVAQGRRPVIDARATSSPQNAGSESSTQIQQGWGWPAAPMGSAGSAIWGQMTQKFNDARNRLQQSLGGGLADQS